VMVPLTQLLIDQVGWRWTYVVTGSLLLLVLVPANALFQRRAPQDVGQFPMVTMHRQRKVLADTRQNTQLSGIGRSEKRHAPSPFGVSPSAISLSEPLCS